jgi:hypothetical protein
MRRLYHGGAYWFFCLLNGRLDGADFVTPFYHAQIGAIESQEFRTSPLPHWLFCFSDVIKGPLPQMFFVSPAAERDGY